MKELLLDIADQLQEDGNIGYSSSVDFGVKGSAKGTRISMNFSRPDDEKINIAWYEINDEGDLRVLSLYEVQEYGGINFDEILGMGASDEELEKFDHIFLPVKECLSYIEVLAEKTAEWIRRDEIESGLDLNLAQGRMVHKSAYNFEVH